MDGEKAAGCGLPDGDRPGAGSILNIYGASADLATEASLSSPGLSSGRKRLGVASYEGAEYILTVREAGEHFCELIGQEIIVQ